MTPNKPRKLTSRQEASSEGTAPERLRALAEDPKLARLVAANPSAPAELLLELSRSDDKVVRKACTSTANTPVEALLKLGSQFPEQLPLRHHKRKQNHYLPRTATIDSQTLRARHLSAATSLQAAAD